MTSLSSLPSDVLLDIFRDLSVVDVVRTGTTCRHLCQSIQDRHVWIDQLEKLRQEHPVLGPATPPLTSLSAQGLKTLVIGWMKLRLCWNNSYDYFTAKGHAGIPGVHHIILLPGGESLLSIDDHGEVALHRIELGDGQVSLPVVANFKSDQTTTFGAGRNHLLSTMLPCPILLHSQGYIAVPSVQILAIDHHNGSINLQSTFHLPEGYSFFKADGQGRVVGFLVQRLALESPRMIIVHLDHPGLTVESEVPQNYVVGGGRVSHLWNICVPTESLAVVYNAEHILACKIPKFSGLSPGVNATPMEPMWTWFGLDQYGIYLWTSLSSMTSEVLYDPLSAQEFNLYYVSEGITSQVITVTLPINASYDDLAPESVDLPVVKQNLTVVESHGRGLEVPFCLKGLFFDKCREGDGVRFLVTPMKDLALHGPRRALQIFVSCRELGRASQSIEINMDEATGRVVIWGWDKEAREAVVFIGDIV